MSSPGNWIAVCLFALLSLDAPSLRAQTAPTPLVQRAIDKDTGIVTLTWRGGADYSPARVKAYGGVDVLASNFEITADTVTGLLPSTTKKGEPPFSEIDADADLGAGHQVTGWFTQYDLGRKYKVTADHAVYSPIADAAAGGPTGTAVFTGHVTLTTFAPEALAEPSVLKTDKLKIVLGPSHSQEYPQIESAPGQMTFTPLE